MPTTDIGKTFNFTSVIWDWNGTLLNDLDLCVKTMNSLLSARRLPLLTNDRYREVFSFPVKDYYEKAGFDFSKEDFEVPAREFIDKYNTSVSHCPLHKYAVQALEALKKKKVRQSVLSAMKQDMLEKTLEYHKLTAYFEKIAGLSDHYATSKVALGKQLVESLGVPVEQTCIIGDTQHDFEVAKESGIRCILIADGHQSKERLLNSGATVINSIGELMELLTE